MMRDTSRRINTRPRLTYPGTADALRPDMGLSLALSASGGVTSNNNGGGVQGMDYDCESTASTSSLLSTMDDTDLYLTSLTAGADAVGACVGASSPVQVRLVHPEYVDCSCIPDDAAQEDVDEALDRARRGLDPKGGGGGNAGKPSSCNKATFPTTLFDILADAELDDVIAWLPHGRSWKILDMPKFAESVLSGYFNQSKYTSFVRQVNGWGFRRVTVGTEANTYYHELFLRGRVSYIYILYISHSYHLNRLCADASCSSRVCLT